jgi:hypothetical protein
VQVGPRRATVLATYLRCRRRPLRQRDSRSSRPVRDRERDAPEVAESFFIILFFQVLTSVRRICFRVGINVLLPPKAEIPPKIRHDFARYFLGGRRLFRSSHPSFFATTDYADDTDKRKQEHDRTEYDFNHSAYPSVPSALSAVQLPFYCGLWRLWCRYEAVERAADIYGKAHELAAIIDSKSIGACGTRDVNRGEAAIVQEKAMLRAADIDVEARDLAAIIDPEAPGFTIPSENFARRCKKNCRDHGLLLFLRAGR